MDHPDLDRTTESKWTKELERNGNRKHYHITVSKIHIESQTMG
jgi:1,2-phenylacetyl-CoA epoxidase PaaB subunit